jgi:hypothetical protein
VRRSTSTSLAAALLLLGASAAHAAASPEALRARTLEIEAGLAKTPAIYLYLDPARKLLEVRSRGMALDRVELQEVTTLHHNPLFGGGDPQPLEIPGVWTVDQGPGDLSREVIAPEALKPYVPEDEREEETAATSTTQGSKPIPDAPSQYFVPLTNGWALAVLDRSPRTSFYHRFAQAVKNGWNDLFGEDAPHPPLVALSMSAADAQRMHHVFRSQLPVLVAAGS